MADSNLSREAWQDPSKNVVAQNRKMSTSSVQAVLLVGPDGEPYASGGEAATFDFAETVSFRAVQGVESITKFGRNSDIDIGNTEDVWEGGGIYTGLDATSNENIAVSSSDVNDIGTEVASGVSTGGSSAVLEDSSAMFVTDGVVVGDLIINDTKGVHGVVSSVSSETQLTVFAMLNMTPNESGDSYRVARATSTGAGVVRISQLLDEDYTQQTPAYAILNGTSSVVVSGNYMRCTRASVVIAGATGLNEGAIVLSQETTTSNVFARIPSVGQTQIAAYTVPAGKSILIKRIRATITRSNGSAGSANVVFYERERGGAWNGRRVFELQTGSTTAFNSEGGIFIPEFTDVKFTVQSVSDNNTIAEAAFEFYQIDN